MSEATRYPLSWPSGWKRTGGIRANATFRRSTPGHAYRTSEQLSVAQALTRLRGELSRLNAADTIVSTNIPVRNDGLPFSGAREPNDPGVAVYFKLKGKPRVLACDKWKRVADNIAAIAKHIEAMRGQDRWGVGSLDQAFAGYTALPASAGGADWRMEMGFEAHPVITSNEIETRYWKLARERHPDHGGSLEAITRLNVARDAYYKENPK